jgi:UPF0042 nucleotide-binding protein
MKELLIISGRSGAGKSVVAKALEDIGFFVVDNLPPQLVDNLFSLRKDRVAIIIDVREKEFLLLLPEIYKNINYNKNLFYIEASEQVLIDRYQETKRRHPLDDGCGIRVALAHEHELLAPIRELASKEIITDKLNAHQLRALIQREFADHEYKVPVTLMSFGFKYGVPSELDLCFDVRFLKNPYYEPALKAKNGLDSDVYEYVLALPHAHEFLCRLFTLIEYLYPLYCLEGKSTLTIAIGCTGGRHRSTSLVEALRKKLESKIEGLRVEHRDLARHN